MREEEIVSDADIDAVWGNANFGTTKRRDIVKFGAFKCACGYYQGSTSRAICTELGLITPTYRITKKGREYLWAAFGSSCV